MNSDSYENEGDDMDIPEPTPLYDNAQKGADLELSNRRPDGLGK